MNKTAIIVLMSLFMIFTGCSKYKQMRKLFEKGDIAVSIEGDLYLINHFAGELYYITPVPKVIKVNKK